MVLVVVGYKTPCHPSINHFSLLLHAVAAEHDQDLGG